MIPIMWVTGPPGVGKTTVAWEIYERFQRTGAQPAYVDVDQLGMLAPSPEADPDRHRLKERNVAVLRRNFAAVGARVLIVSGVVDPFRGLDVSTLGGSPVGMARLRTDPDDLRARLRHRNGQLEPQRGSLAQAEGAVAVAEVLDRSSFVDWCIDTTMLPIAEVAASLHRTMSAWLDVEGQQAIGGSSPRSDPRPAPGELLWVSGPTGVGKSTIGYRAYFDVLRSGGCAAFVDVDQLGFCGTAPSTPSLRVQNLAALWNNFAHAGARLAVVVGGVLTRAEARRYEQALPEATITWCRLRVDDAELTRRIVSRGEGGSWAQPGDPLRGRTGAELLAVADRAITETLLLEQTKIGLRVDIDDLDVRSAAAHLLKLARWPTTGATESD